MAKMTFSDMYCTYCGKKGIPVQRHNGRDREAGHLKKMFCIYCQQERNMVEIRNFGSGYTLFDFEFEYEHNNFDENGNRIMSLGELRKEFRDEETSKEFC